MSEIIRSRTPGPGLEPFSAKTARRVTPAVEAILGREVVSAAQIESSVRHLTRVVHGVRRVSERTMFESVLLGQTRQMLMGLGLQPDQVAVLDAIQQVAAMGMLDVVSDATGMMRSAE